MDEKEQLARLADDSYWISLSTAKETYTEKYNIIRTFISRLNGYIHYPMNIYGEPNNTNNSTVDSIKETFVRYSGSCEGPAELSYNETRRIRQQYTGELQHYLPIIQAQSPVFYERILFWASMADLAAKIAEKIINQTFSVAAFDFENMSDEEKKRWSVLFGKDYKKIVRRLEALLKTIGYNDFEDIQKACSNYQVPEFLLPRNIDIVASDIASDSNNQENTNDGIPPEVVEALLTVKNFRPDLLSPEQLVFLSNLEKQNSHGDGKMPF